MNSLFILKLNFERLNPCCTNARQQTNQRWVYKKLPMI